MKKLLISAVALLLLSTCANATPSKDDAEYWVASTLTASRIFLFYCTDYEPIPETISSFADKYGLDAEAINYTITQEMRFMNGDNYDEKNVVPRVAAIARHVAVDVVNALHRGGKRIFCSDAAPTIGLRFLRVSASLEGSSDLTRLATPLPSGDHG